MSQKHDKLVTLLKELFQIDQPDLDFGIYRVLHAKSAEVTQFLDKDLLPQIGKAFEQYRSADRAELEKKLATAVEQAKGLGADPDATPKVQELKSKIANESVDISKLESEVYDHLYSFFRRYYSEGDFLSKRVYKPGVYAIPYEGEEVKLHWANADQYYIKTSEYLRDFAFRLNPFADEEKGEDPMRVHFRLTDAAEGEHGNVKESGSNKRVFVLSSGDEWILEENGELVIRFEYRPATLTDWPEDEREGKKKPPAQKDLLEIAEKRILSVENAGLLTWVNELRKPHIKADGTESEKSRIRVNLERYTARNTFDYFIHKDLGGFLRRELDFYIKNEVMHLDDIESDTAPRVEQYLSKIKVIRSIAHKIIDFLAQLEDFQKKLWLKKKFVVETSYLIRVGIIPEEFYAEIAANDAQRQEWIDLLSIDEIEGNLTSPGYSDPLTTDFLTANPTLLIDSRHFEPSFVDLLLDSIGSVEEQNPSVLINSENYQALALIRKKLRKLVSGIYIDPPYNTDATEIVYKNGYKDSSWCALMQDRLELAKRTLSDDGIACTTIDEREVNNLALILEQTMNAYELRPIIIEYNLRGRVKSNFAITHEYALWSIPAGKDLVTRKREISEDIRRNLRRTGTDSTRQASPRQFYGIRVNKKTLEIIGVTDALALGDQIPNNSDSSIEVVWPIDDEGVERRWYYGSDRVLAEAVEGTVWAKRIKGTIQIHYHQDGKPKLRKSIWSGNAFDSSTHGSELLNDLFGLGNVDFNFPKSIHAVTECLESMTYDTEAQFLDYFAGSGTTGHAVINLNREDGGQRRFYLVEMGQYFDSVTRPRIQKVIFSPAWKNGKPVRLVTDAEAERSPKLIKAIVLESYEDALNNLELKRSATQESLLDLAESKEADGFREQYMLRYMLDVESRGSQSLLNVAAFTDPTAYKLIVKRPGSDESREANVDLIETFNWLIGLTVHGIAAPRTFTADFERDSEKRLQIKGRLRQDADGPYWFRTVTGTVPDGRKTLVIWRKLTGDPEQDNLVLDEWFTRQGYSSKDSEYDLIYVNGDNNLENLRAADDTWKVRLIEEDFHRLMFDTEDA